MPTSKPGHDVVELIASARARGQRTLSEPDSKTFLRALGIPVPPGRVVSSPAEAASVLDEIPPPVVVKAVSSVLTHKTDVGGIVFPVESAAAAAAACVMIAARVRQARPDVVLDGFLVEAYRPAQPEWILGLRIDRQFGPAVMFGLGGIFVELLRQVSFRLAPLRDADIDALLTEKPATRILEGVRGNRPADREGLKAAIRALSDLSGQAGIADAISEIEINPLTVTEQGILALDALIVLRAKEARS
jgi:succinyl-CoA synthetase beta subunit